MCENPRRSAVSEILKPTCLAPTIIPQSNTLRSHFFPILLFDVNIKWSSWPVSAWFYALHCCHDWLMYMNKYTECMNKQAHWLRCLVSVEVIHTSWEYNSPQLQYLHWNVENDRNKFSIHSYILWLSWNLEIALIYKVEAWTHDSTHWILKMMHLTCSVHTPVLSGMIFVQTS